MRIAVLSAACSIHTARWAAALAARGHEVALFSLARHRAPASLTIPGVQTTLLSGGYLRAAGALRAALDAIAPDILHAHYATGYGTLARKGGFHPLLLSVWGSDVYDFPRMGPVHRGIVRRNLRAADGVASTAARMAAHTRALCPGLPELFITPFGVDTAVFTPAAHPPGAVPGAPLSVGIVKTLAPKYGVDVLLRAFARLPRYLAGHPLRLCVYGDGPQRRQLGELVRKLELGGRVHFYGAVAHQNVPEVLRGMDVFCAPSVLDSESFGVAAVEAMACGLPVAAGAVDGFKEVLRDGETGLLVPPGDDAALAGALRTLLSDAAMRARMGKAARADVQARFEWRGCVDKMEHALIETARRAGGAA